MSQLNDEISLKIIRRQSMKSVGGLVDPIPETVSLPETLKSVYQSLAESSINEEIDKLKRLYEQMELKFKLIKEKTIFFGNNFFSKIKYYLYNLSMRILAIYCIYRIIMTVKNLLFQRYSDINIMLRDEIVNVIDFSLNIVFHILNLDVGTVYYTVIEQYFSFFIVGIIIITNIRSFLNTILFIYSHTIKRYKGVVSKKIEMLFLAYFVGLFYVTSCIFLIFNLPITYR
jgi:hypothetical protein